MNKVWVCLLLCVASAASAESPVVVTEDSVTQYRQAATAAKTHLSGAVEVEPGDPALAERLSEASVVVAVGQKALAAAKKAAPEKPVVFCLVLGATQDLISRTVTGVPLEADPAVVLGHMKALAPEAKRVGIIYNPGAHNRLVTKAKAVASGLGIEIVTAEATSASAVKPLLEDMASKIDAVWLAPDPALFNREVFRYLLGFTAERGIPLFGFLDTFTEAGALASVAPDYADIGDRAGRLAADIARKAKAERVPVPEPVYAPGRLSINTRTARALGLSLPDAAVSKAKQVYR